VPNRLRGRIYRIVGHKWFFSAPMCDAFLILAQAPRGLSCFLLPRFTPDGSVNAIRIQRLKDKLGDRSNASSEVEFENTHAELVGEEGRGIATILAMGTYCRLDCVLGTAGLVRGAVSQAIAPRAAPSRIRQAARGCAADAQRARRPGARVGGRGLRSPCASGGPSTKPMKPPRCFAVSSRPPRSSGSAGADRRSRRKRMEVLGGNGYVEEGPLARLYRQMPLNSIWEGAGNIMCLDVLRAVHRDARCVDAIADELALAKGGNATLDRLRASDAARVANDPGRGRGARADAALGARHPGIAPRTVCAGIRRGLPSARRGSQRLRSRAVRSARRPFAHADEIVARAWPTDHPLPTETP
jgi:putative acyl-CoA dehydrogenase